MYKECEYEEKPRICCDLTIIDEDGDVTKLSKSEQLCYDAKLSQILNWFRQLLNCVGYSYIKEVKAISKELEFSSEDF